MVFDFLNVIVVSVLVLPLVPSFPRAAVFLDNLIFWLVADIACLSNTRTTFVKFIILLARVCFGLITLIAARWTFVIFKVTIGAFAGTVADFAVFIVAPVFVLLAAFAFAKKLCIKLDMVLCPLTAKD